MSNMLRNIVRSGALKSISSSIQQSNGIRAVGARSLWHMSKLSINSGTHKCSGFGCTCRIGARFASTNGNNIVT